MKINSPVTYSNNVSKVDTLKVEDIIEVYKGFSNLSIQKYFSGIQRVDIYKCLDTGYRFFYPFSISGDREFYAFLEKSMNYYEDWRWEHRIIYRKIALRRKVLEIGCGNGDFIYKLKKEKIADCVGLEFNHSAIKIARDKGLSVINETIEQHALKNSSRYDFVCSFQVFEHISDVKSHLESSIACLKEKGLLVIGVPNNNPYLFQHDKYHALNLPPHHMGLWDKESLRNLEKFFPIKLESILVEPLYDTDYFWDVMLKYFKKNNRIAYFITSIISKYFKKLRNRFSRKIYEGRNILAIYSKNHSHDKI